jgi:hypothetical protein
MIRNPSENQAHCNIVYNGHNIVFIPMNDKNNDNDDNEITITITMTYNNNDYNDKNLQ